MSPLSALALLWFLAPLVPQGSWIDAYLSGERALAAGELSAARGAFTRVASERPDHAPSAWGLACVAAQEGQEDRAFEWLRRVEASGGGERALLEWDPDLASLRPDPRFETLCSKWGLEEVSEENELRWVPEAGSWPEAFTPFAVSLPDRKSVWNIQPCGVLLKIDAATGRTVQQRKVSELELVSLACGPQGKTVCVQDQDRVTHLLDAESLEPQAEWKGAHDRWRRYGMVRYAPNESLLAVTSGVGDVTVFDTRSGEVRWSGTELEREQRFSWSDDSQGLLIRKTRLELLRIAFDEEGRGVSELSLPFASEVGPHGYQPGTHHCFVGTREGMIYKVDASDGEVIHRRSTAGLDVFGLPSPLQTLAFDSRGERVMMGTSGVGCSVMADTSSLEILWRFAYRSGNPGGVRVAFSSDDSKVYLGGGRSVYPHRTVDARTGRLIPEDQEVDRGAVRLVAGDCVGVERTRFGLRFIDWATGKDRFTRVHASTHEGLLVASTGHIDGPLQELQTLNVSFAGEARPLIDFAVSLLDSKRVRAVAEGVVIRPPMIR